MPYPRKANRTRNACGTPAAASPTPLCGLCRTAAPPSQLAHCHCPAKTLSDGTAATAATSASSLSDCSSQLSAAEEERDVRPVTGACANVADEYSVSPDVLGEGKYGVVRGCVHRATGQSFAVKSIDKSKIERLDRLRREISLLASLDHRGIVRMVDFYEDAGFVHIITEKYAGGELFGRILDNLGSHGCFSERKAGTIIKSLLEAVSYLHEKGVVHRDIKPENILFESNDEDSPVRLIDFGVSRRHARGEAPMTSPVGTAYYMSPELVAGRYDRATDLWSVGVVAYILLCGLPPFNGASDAEIHEATMTVQPRFQGNGWADKSDEAVDFVKCLLRRHPRRRFAAREALMHPWIRNKMTI